MIKVGQYVQMTDIPAIVGKVTSASNPPATNEQYVYFEALENGPGGYKEPLNTWASKLRVITYREAVEIDKARRQEYEEAEA